MSERHRTRPRHSAGRSGRAVEAFFARYTLRVEGPEGASVLVESETPVWRGTLGTWRTAGFPPGLYTIVVRVEDEAGNASESVRTVALQSGPSLTRRPLRRDGRMARR